MKRRRRIQREGSDSDGEDWISAPKSRSNQSRVEECSETIEIIDLEDETSNTEILVINESSFKSNGTNDSDAPTISAEKRGKNNRKADISKESKRPGRYRINVGTSDGICRSQLLRSKLKEQRSVLQFMVPTCPDVQFDSSRDGSSKAQTAVCERQQDSGRLWVDKYQPQRSEDLVIQAKKIQEFESWLERNQRLLKDGDNSTQRVLVLHGPCGSGKSALVQVISKRLGFKIVEWSCSASVSFEQHRSANLNYASDVDQFSAFVCSALKFSPLEMSTCDCGSGRDGTNELESRAKSRPDDSRDETRVLVVVEDFPNIYGQAQIDVLERTLNHLRINGRHLAVLIKSDDQGRGDGRQLAGVLRRLMGMRGVGNIHMNKVAVTALRKCLGAIVLKERIKGIDDSTLQQIAETSDGDVRNGINALQMYCKLGQAGRASEIEGGMFAFREPAVKRKKGTKGLKGRSAAIAASSTSVAACFGRDHSLVIFSVLGRILHNKRLGGDGSGTEPEDAGATRRADVSLGPEDGLEAVVCSGPGNRPARRGELAFVPEDVLGQSGLGGDHVMGFLHENLIPFFDDVTDLAAALSFLSDGDMLSSSKVGRFSASSYTGSVSSGGLGGDYGFSVAARGVLWSNHHVVSKYTALRRPGAHRALDAAGRLRDAVRPMLTPPLPEAAGLSTRSLVCEVLPYVAQQARQPGGNGLSVAQQAWLRRASGAAAFGGIAPGARLRSSFCAGPALRPDDADDESGAEELYEWHRPGPPAPGGLAARTSAAGPGGQDLSDPIDDFSD